MVEFAGGGGVINWAAFTGSGSIGRFFGKIVCLVTKSQDYYLFKEEDLTTEILFNWLYATVL